MFIRALRSLSKTPATRSAAKKKFSPHRPLSTQVSAAKPSSSKAIHWVLGTTAGLVTTSLLLQHQDTQHKNKETALRRHFLVPPKTHTLSDTLIPLTQDECLELINKIGKDLTMLVPDFDELKKILTSVSEEHRCDIIKQLDFEKLQSVLTTSDRFIELLKLIPAKDRLSLMLQVNDKEKYLFPVILDKPSQVACNVDKFLPELFPILPVDAQQLAIKIVGHWGFKSRVNTHNELADLLKVTYDENQDLLLDTFEEAHLKTLVEDGLSFNQIIKAINVNSKESFINKFTTDDFKQIFHTKISEYGCYYLGATLETLTPRLQLKVIDKLGIDHINNIFKFYSRHADSEKRMTKILDVLPERTIRDLLVFQYPVFLPQVDYPLHINNHKMK